MMEPNHMIQSEPLYGKIFIFQVVILFDLGGTYMACIIGFKLHIYVGCLSSQSNQLRSEQNLKEVYIWKHQ